MNVDGLMALATFLAWIFVVQCLIGTILALLAAGALRFARRLNASTRHAIWMALLVTLAMLPVSLLLPADSRLAAGLLTAGPSSVAPTAELSIEHVLPASASSSSAESSSANERSLKEPSAGGIASRLASLLIAALWLAAIGWRLGHLSLALHRTRRLEQSAHQADRTSAQVTRLGHEASLQRVPEVRRHASFATPAVVGWWHPWLAVPTSWPGDLSPAAQRNILLHELAHVERRDGWWSLAQRIAECLLALHPCRPFLSRQIDIERESACDDWATSRASVSPETYGDSLLEARLPGNTTPFDLLAASYVRSQGQLKRRVINMTDRYRNHQPTTRRPAVILFVGCLAAAGWSTAWAWPGLPEAPLQLSQTLVAQATLEAGHPGPVPSRTVLAADDAPLFAAVQRQRVGLVERLLDAGEDVDQVWPGDGSPLIQAARTGNVRLVTLFLDRGADPNLGVDGDGTPLIQAAAQDDYDVVQLLIERGAEIDHAGSGGDGNPLIQSSMAGHRRMVAHLIEQGATIDIHVPGDDTPLINAAQQGRVAVVDLLLESGADPNLEGDFDRLLGKVRTPLNQARARGHQQVVDQLLAAGARD